MADHIEPSQGLGNAIWMRRDRELGVGREEFARRTGWRADGNRTTTKRGLSPATIARIERGQRGIGSDRELNLLARALDLTPRALIGRISQAGSLPSTGDAYALPDLIAAIDDSEIRATLGRIADDLAGLAGRIARGPGG